VEMAERFSGSFRGRVLLTGSPGERKDVDDLAESMKMKGVDAVSLAGRNSIGQTMAVIEKSKLVVANDSAPMHMAVGYARPLVGLFGPTDPREVGPYGRDEAVLRPQGASGKGRDYRMPSRGSGAMSDIEVGAVLEAALKQLEVYS
jgi:ADP-heptose:LPS heptosyltransferase